jgi:hypothetical protein
LEALQVKKEKANMYPTDLCLETGEYTDDCCCDFCTHREECSGYDGEDDDDD